MKPKGARREPKTQRGKDVVAKVNQAATALLSENWLDTVSISQLAKEAGVSRASLLLQYPQGWRDVVFWLLNQIVGIELYELACDLAEESSDRSVNQKLYELLERLLNQAEGSGLLYANLRSLMFVWGDEFEGMWVGPVSCDVIGSMAGMLESVMPDKNPKSSFVAAEMLFYGAMDLAAASASFAPSFRDRKIALRTMIDVTVRGLRGGAE